MPNKTSLAKDKTKETLKTLRATNARREMSVTEPFSAPEFLFPKYVRQKDYEYNTQNCQASNGQEFIE